MALFKKNKITFLYTLFLCIAGQTACTHINTQVNASTQNERQAFISNTLADVSPLLLQEAPALPTWLEQCAQEIGEGCWKVGFFYDLDASVRWRDAKKAAQAYTLGCTVSDPNKIEKRACTNAGWAYMEGNGVTQDYQKAYKLYEIACNLDDVLGCANLGGMHQDGLGMPVNYAKAKLFYEKSCTDKYTEGCLPLGWLYENGLGMDADIHTAINFYIKACQQNPAGDGCHTVGFWYETGQDSNGITRIPAMPEKSGEYYQKSCEAGNATGCFYWGYWYWQQFDMPAHLRITTKVTDGSSLPNEIHVERAQQLYLKSCEGGYATGCFDAGWVHEFVDATSSLYDIEKSLELYEKACQLGDGEGCYNAGYILDVGEKYPADLARALDLYARACAAGDAKGCTGAGWVYQNEDRFYNMRQARKFYEEGCAKNDSTACGNLGALYLYGTDVVQDIGKARSLLEQSCNDAYGYACSTLAFLYNGDVLDQAQSNATGIPVVARPDLLSDEEGKIKAQVLWEQACILEYQEACEYKNLLPQLNPSSTPPPRGDLL